MIGAGIVGLATAIEAAKNCTGRVICLDPFGEANAYGASGDGMRLFRVSYFEHPSYVPLLQESIPAWNELGADLYQPVGGFYAGPPDSELIAGAIQSANQHHLPHEVLTRQESMRRYPMFNLPEDYIGFFEPQAGFIRAAKATRAMAAKARSLGVQIIWDKVISLQPDFPRWLVGGQKTFIETGLVIVAAGAASSEILPRLRQHLRPETHLLTWFESDDEAWKEAPGFGIMNSEGEMLYGFPAVDKVPGVKIGGHHQFSSGDVGTQEEGLRRLASQHLNGLSETILSTKTCVYDMSPDGHFIIGKIDRAMIVACGFSGHGFKFGSVIGKVVWEAATNGLPKHLSFLDVKRFTSTSGLT